VNPESRYLGDEDRTWRMAYSLVMLHEHEPENYAEFVDILRHIDLVQKVDVEAYRAARSGIDPEYMSVLFDDMNIGFLSDGTLRVCEIVLGLLEKHISALLIEEPETAVHPGLLHRLLAVIDSYALDRQVVVSTHSPIVVNGCRPTELRLVERTDGVTSVRALSADDVHRVEAYLNDEGTFSDFVYSQADE
jgi:predicted ATPase